MKKILLVTLLIMSAMCASAATFTTMRLVTTSQTEHLIGLDGLEITVADGILTAANATETLSVPVADLATMEFSSKQSGIAGVEHTGEQTPVTVYGIDGKDYGTFASTSAASAALPAGTYIIKATDNTTTKLTLRK